MKPEDPACSDGQKRCDSLQPQVCEGGVWKDAGAACETSCVAGECQAAVVCEEGKKQCADKQPQVCEGGAWKDVGSACETSCVDGECQAAGQVCGDGVRTGSESCDKKDFGGKTCADFLSDVPKTAVVSGDLICTDQCEIDSSRCEISWCGNNIFDADKNEFCDVVDGVSKFYQTPEPTCSVLNAKNCGQPGMPTCYEYEDGGRPGCSADCKSFKKGTCKIKAQPMDGIQTCEFSSLTYDPDTREIVAHARVTTMSGLELGQAAVSGRLSCTSDTSAATYAWNLGRSEARFLENCDGGPCAEDEYALIADSTLPLLSAGTYSCAFAVHVNAGQASSSMSICPISDGFPLPEGTVDEGYLRTFNVDESALPGTILAGWTFAKFENKTTALEAFADVGVMASQAVLKVSDGSEMTFLAGLGGYPESAAALSNLDKNAVLKDYAKTRHFAFQLSTLGYQNIRLKYAIAGSDVEDKTIATTLKIQDAYALIGDLMTVEGKNVFKQFPLMTVMNADNRDSIEIGVYLWSEPAVNQSLRIDDVYVIGDPLPETP